MSGKLLRLVGTTMAVAQLALAPAHAAAVPDPQPQPPADAPRQPPADTDDAPAPPLAAEGAPESLPTLLTQLQTLYQQAEVATEAYNATEEALKKKRAEVARLDTALAKARLSLHAGRGAAGRLARQQYQNSSDLSPYLRLLLASDPEHAIDEGHVIGRLARERAQTIGRLTGSERRAADLARRARTALDQQLTLTERQKKQRDDVRRRLSDVERLLASLTADQLTALTALERTGAAEAQRSLVASGALDGDDKPPSTGGERAVRYAERQIGKPYAWGAEGPASYDCSGLTSQAWQAAGTPIPRTSQEQWARLPHVPLRTLRPGDLVVYFPQATHVALYVGGGKVVEAPRTGEKIKLSPIAAHPILGAVRPDPKPLPANPPRPLPTPKEQAPPAPKEQAPPAPKEQAPPAPKEQAPPAPKNPVLRPPEKPTAL
ncbi:NlpC/P60 family protein [Streptomyces sp. NPDC028635]|uniref:NlpC/P60 family protein n=1 Tax=Streptomyces sp. NPDC028635 TaxID=3154800 RepID=UPI00340EB032